MPTVSSTSSSPSLAITGLASGMDWSTVVSALANAERAPETQWKQSQTNLNTQNSAFSSIKSDLATLQADIKALQDSTLYDSRAVQTSNPGVGTATAAPGATAGNFAFDITQLATAAQMNGTSSISQVLSVDGNLSNVTLGTAGFSTAVTGGTFTVDGKQITIAATDSLQSVFDQIAAATNNTVTASYDSAADKITLASSTNSEIVLGSATDSSNFLQAAQLSNSGIGTITSANPLGSVRLTAAMGDSHLATPISDGDLGQGQFIINGVSISFNASNDSIQNVLDRINNSGAGVTASFDARSDRFVLTNNLTCNLGFSMQDVTGNFLAATGLSSGTLAHGQNLLYTLNGSSTPLTSQSNTITPASSGIAGLSLTALATGTVSVAVSVDASKISSALQKFVTDYNSVQNFISSQMIVTTGSDGSTTPGPLTGDQTASSLASSLRAMLSSVVSAGGLPGSMNQLADLGITTNGQNNTVAFDSTGFTATLANNLNNVKTLFSDPANGWALQANNYLDATIGDNGSLVTHQTTLTNQSNSINAQISALESKITSDTKKWNTEFQAMEVAESQTNQELTYLSQQISSGAL